MPSSGFHWVRIMVTLTFVAMVVVNALANILPINGVTTGEVSDAYPDLFAPAGITFSIWGVIYLLLLGYILHQWGVFGQIGRKQRLWQDVGVYFSVSSVANVIWIFAWHHHRIATSLALIVVMLLCLIRINDALKEEDLLVRLPFSIYFGWITVATIANVTTFLVSVGWGGLGVTEPVWTAIVLVIGVAIGLLTAVKNRDVAYALVLVWAYAGILLKHVSATGFAGEYPLVIGTAIVCIIALLVGDARVLQLKAH